MKRFKSTILGITVGIVAGVLVACAPAIAQDKDGEYLDYLGEQRISSLGYNVTVYRDNENKKVIYLYNGNIAVEDIYNRR